MAPVTRAVTEGALYCKVETLPYTETTPTTPRDQAHSGK